MNAVTNREDAMPNETMTTREVADLLGVGVSSVKRWTDEGRLECLRTAGGHRRFETSEVERFRRETSRGETSTKERSYPSALLEVDGHRLPAPLHEMSEVEIDRLPMGVIQLDDEGTVLIYNQAESDLSGRSRDKVIGRHFFTEVAPCTNNNILRGRFEEGVAMEGLDCTVDYTFTYKMRPTPVRIRLRRDGPSKTNWMIITRIDRAPKRRGGRRR